MRERRWLVWLWPIVGLGALAWFLVRVLPKPSRAAYPCQRLAAPLASSFVVWLLGLGGALVALRKARERFRDARYALAALCLAAGLAMGLVALVHTPERRAAAASLWVPPDPSNTPVGTAQGVHPGRVVWTRSPQATTWDGSGSWWESQYTDQARVDHLMSQSVRLLTGEATDSAAWDALFRHFNQAHGGSDAGYQAGEKVAIKINMNNSWSYGWGNSSNTSPQALRALLGQLVSQAGVPEAAITVYDASRYIGDPVYNACHAAFPGVRFEDTSGQRGRSLVQRAASGQVHYADAGIEAGGQTDLPTCVANANYLINLALLKGHVIAGVTLCAKNWFGSVWHEGQWSPGFMHDYIGADNRPMGSYNPLVDLMGHPHLGGKTLLFVIDALYGAVDQGAVPSPWVSAPFNDGWTASLFVSQDGVAIDSVAVDFLRNEPSASDVVQGTLDNYLHEAAQAGDPPSGAFYDPGATGTRLSSLGVHEHWNNATDKQYSRNLGAGNGIELVSWTASAAVTLQVQPGTGLDFGAVDAGDTKVLADAYTLTNTGADPLFVFATVGAPFHLLGDGGVAVNELSFALDAGAETKLSFDFAPTRTGPAADTIHILSTGGDAARTATGSGVLPTVSIAATDAQASETAPGQPADTGTFRIRRSSARGDLPVAFKRGGAASFSPGGDYTLAVGALALVVTSIVIPDGQDHVDITVLPLDDLRAEPTESVTLTLKKGKTYRLDPLPANQVATVNILDDEPVVSVEALDPTAAETPPGQPADTGTFRIHRTNSRGDLPVSFKRGGTASFGPRGDYTLSVGAANLAAAPVVIPDGQDHVDITVAPLDDLRREATETVVLTLTKSKSYHLDPTPGAIAATVSISSNE